MLSKNEGDFVVAAIRDGIRSDGRRAYDVRGVKIAFSADFGHTEVQLGKTRVVANVSADIERPHANSPTEGFVNFSTSFSPMAAPTFEAGRISDEEVLVSRLLEKALRKSRAVDTEGLCIVAGEKVWSIRIDIHVIDHDGNIVDCACIAAVTALLQFKRPDVTVDGDEVTIHSIDERTPIPLSIHHIPICITFGFFDNGYERLPHPTKSNDTPRDLLVVDPNHLEEQVQYGEMTIVVNSHRELCTISKGGGTSLEIDQIIRCAEMAAMKAADITDLIRTAVSNNTELKEKGAASYKKFNK